MQLGQNINYTPPKTIAEFMQSDKLARYLMGPVGSAKTTGCIMELVMRSAQQAKGPDGYRRTRWAIVRNTLQQIKTTVLKDIQQILTPIVHWKVSESTIFIEAGDIRSEWMLIPLDSIEDQRRLLSTQLTGAWVNEWREVNPDLITALMGRIGRYPSPMVGGPTWHGLIADSNPGTEDSPWFEKLELNLPSKWGFFKQPGGLDPDAENVENLPKDYYANLMEGAEEDWVLGHVHGQWMPSLAGTAVFRTSFDPSVHISKSSLQTIPGNSICSGLDLGRTPTAIITQMDWKGRLLILEEVIGKDTGLEQFLNTQLTPALQGDHYSRSPIYIVFDPSGMSKSQLSEVNAFDIIKNCGFVGLPAPCRNNDVAIRLAAVTKHLLRREGFIIDGVRCPMLIQAMKFQYRYKRKKTGELEEKPEKLHPWSDLADGLQYACLGINERVKGRAMRRLAPDAGSYSKAHVPTGAWT